MSEQQVLEQMQQEMASIPGHTGFYYHNLVSGRTFSVRGAEAFGAASVIKLPLFLHILKEAAAGRMDMDEVLTVTEEDKVPICGALTLFTGPVQADVRTLCRLMISISDNTATNKLIRHCGMETLRESFEGMGLSVTRLRRELFDSAASRRGIQNTISPEEMGMLLKQVHEGAFGKEAQEVLGLQQINHKLDGKLCGRADVLHKTGEDDELSNDVGIVYAKEPFILCFAGENTDVYRWEDFIRRSTCALWEALENE